MDNTANPAPLGLCAFGMTTILLCIHNAGLIALSSGIIAMAIFYGGFAQVIAGAMEWKKNNTFGFVTFGSFGFFWISLAFLVMLPVAGLSKAAGPADMAAFLGVWALFTLGLLVCTIKMHRSLMVTIFMLLVTFVLLITAELTASTTIRVIGGAAGIITGLLALYIGIGQLVNEVHGRRVLPV